jgi:hypothetical protein
VLNIVYIWGEKKTEEESMGVVGVIIYSGGDRTFSGFESLHSVPTRPSGKGTSEIG